ncbi:MAG: efflux RND transporter periplasmic adaptor subunit [Parachlamydiaceae bacterium]
MNQLKFLFYGFMAFILGGITFYTLTPYPTSTEQRVPEIDHEHKTAVKLTDEQTKRLNLKFSRAQEGSLIISLPLRGKIILHPDRLAHVFPKVAGIVQEATKNIGNEVKQGDTMAIIESSEMADIKANFRATLSKLKLAASVLDREKKLFQEKITPQSEFLNAKNIYEEAAISVQLARQRLKTFGISDEEIEKLSEDKDPDLRLYAIHAPIDGTVIMRHITQGEYVENKTMIYEIANLNTVWIEIGVFPKDIYHIRKGQIVSVINPINNKSAQAKIIYVSPIISDDTITAKAIAELDNTEKYWKPGTFIKVSTPTEKIQGQIIVPKTAIQGKSGKEFMFVKTSEGLEKRDIKVGKNNDTQVIVLSGLEKGEEYVINQTFLLRAELEKNSVEHED